MGRSTADGMDEALSQAPYSCPSLPLGTGPYYSQMFPEMAEQFNNVIRSAVSPGTAIKSLQSDLQRIIQQG
jgi:hypothetical protein